MKVNNNISDNVADTLYIPLAMRCKETKRRNPFFSDPFACDILQKINYDFSKYEKAVRSSVGVALRAEYFDSIAKAFIRENERPVIVHIGCGLDTRSQRLGKTITDKAFIYELDLPEVIDLRKQLLPESENNINLPYSMFEKEWIAMLKEKHPDSCFLFAAEGVMMYFTNEQIKGVFISLAEQFNGSKILFDVTSTWMSKNSHRHDTVKLTNASFKMKCDDDHLMEQWSSNLELEKAVNYSDFDNWKRVGFLNNMLMRLIPVIRNGSRILLYRINEHNS